MLVVILVILFLLWLLGMIQIPWLSFHNMVLFSLVGHQITLLQLLLFIVAAWAIEALPSPLRQIAFILIVLWLLSLFGIIAVAGLSNLLILAIIIGLVLALFQHH